MKANVFCPDGKFHYAEFSHTDAVTALSVLSDAPADGQDFIIPGLVDIHTHGAVGCDFSDGDPAGLIKLSEYYAKKGVTSFLATTVTLDEERLLKAMEAVREFKPGKYGARCLGVHLEGPFISLQKKGAQNAAYIRKPDFDLFCRLNAASGNAVRLVDVAPENDGDFAFIGQASKRCRVSLAHTEADYDTACAAFLHGADHVTHLFNAMPPFLHRAPGVVGAAFDSKAYAELIADGVHVHPAAVRAAFALFSPNRICLVSDSVRCAGLADGKYTLGGQEITLRSGRATLSDGTLAGSSIHLMDALKNAIRFGVGRDTVVRAATVNPARSVGLESIAGILSKGRSADYVVLTPDFTVKDVRIAGGSVL